MSEIILCRQKHFVFNWWRNKAYTAKNTSGFNLTVTGMMASKAGVLRVGVLANDCKMMWTKSIQTGWPWGGLLWWLNQWERAIPEYSLHRCSLLPVLESTVTSYMVCSEIPLRVWCLTSLQKSTSSNSSHSLHFFASVIWYVILASDYNYLNIHVKGKNCA